MKAILTFFSLIIIIKYSMAGIINDNLLERLGYLKESEKIECVIILAEQFDLESFKKNMTMANSTRAERHAYIINNLKEIASRTQPDLLAYLEKEKNSVGWIITRTIGLPILSKRN